MAYELIETITEQSKIKDKLPLHPKIKLKLCQQRNIIENQLEPNCHQNSEHMDEKQH